MDEAGVKVIRITLIGRKRTNCCFMTTFIDVQRTFDKNGWMFDFSFSFFSFFRFGRNSRFPLLLKLMQRLINSRHRIKSSQKVLLSMHDYLWHIKGIIDDLYNSWLFYLYFISYWSNFLGFTLRVWHLDHLYYHMLWFICYQP